MISEVSRNIAKYYEMMLNIGPEWFTAIGTVSAATIALYFGLSGNRGTRVLLRNIENGLDQEAFRFLASVPDEVILPIGSREFISKFEKKLLDNVAIRNKKLKQFNGYVKLAEEFSSNEFLLYTEHKEDNRIKRKNIFTKIKKQAKKLSKTVDTQTKLKFMRKLWLYESKNLWEKNIFQLLPKDSQDKGHPAYFVYSDVSDNDVESHKNARKIVQEHFNKDHKETDKFYEKEDVCECLIYRPSNRWEDLYGPDDRSITIILDGKKYELLYKEPRLCKGPNQDLYANSGSPGSTVGNLKKS